MYTHKRRRGDRRRAGAGAAGPWPGYSRRGHDGVAPHPSCGQGPAPHYYDVHPSDIRLRLWMGPLSKSAVPCRASPGDDMLVGVTEPGVADPGPGVTAPPVPTDCGCPADDGRDDGGGGWLRVWWPMTECVGSTMWAPPPGPVDSEVIRWCGGWPSCCWCWWCATALPAPVSRGGEMGSLLIRTETGMGDWHDAGGGVLLGTLMCDRPLHQHTSRHTNTQSKSPEQHRIQQPQRLHFLFLRLYHSSFSRVEWQRSQERGT